MTITKDMAWYWLTNIDGIGRKSIERLIGMFGVPEEIYNASDRVIDSIPFLTAIQKNNLKSKNIDAAARELERLPGKGISFVHYESSMYPDRLKMIADRPYGLYVRNESDEAYEMFDRPCVAIIGSRKCSDYGYRIAYNIAVELSSYNITIISGLAKGIDGAAQSGAIAANGSTCGVLGCGVDICYPSSNIELYMDVIRNGMLMSEYTPGTKPLAGYFPERNRIISGLSDIIIVVEAGKKSGSLITIDLALEQGRDVYAVPGRITDAGSYGCNQLIKNGAALYSGVRDILEELGINKREEASKCVLDNNSLATEEKIVYARLSLEPTHIDSLIEHTGLPAKKVMEVLLTLEMRHLVRQTAYNYYVIDI